ncbi:MAG: DUF1015 domain-containing protein [Bdellovibrionota bacterium]|jgi:uncharacterized protein (DUF1015 family)
MVQIKSFKALRPAQPYAAAVSALPYDVMNRAEAKQLADGNPRSFLRITRSEIELAEDINPYDPQVYQHAKENLDLFLSNGTLLQDETPQIYIYRLIRNGRSQSGVVALSAVDDYQSGVIKIHEKTRTEKVQDRTQHILSTSAQTGPVFLTFRDTSGVTTLIEEGMRSEPLYDFVASDGVQHTIWRSQKTTEIIAAFSKIPNTYIADGHHRAASSANCREVLKGKNPHHRGDEEYNFFLSVLFPEDQLEILPYNRIIKTSSLSAEEALNKIGEVLLVDPNANPHPSSKRHISMYLAGKWYGLSLPQDFEIPQDIVEALDVSILYSLVLNPIFKIGDLRSDNNIDFIGGVRGTEELERLVNCGEAFCAFSMYPVTISDLLTVADQGKTMAPKSTWFEPKLRSGLLVHLI